MAHKFLIRSSIFASMLSTALKNQVLEKLAVLIDQHRQAIINANLQDLEAYTGEDASMFDRLKVNSPKVESMIDAVRQCILLEDPENKVIYTYTHPNGMRVENRTVALGTILIIYESRPDVTIEAAITAFKAGNRILLKGGKEARKTNLVLVELWHEALKENGLESHWVEYLDLARQETQDLIKNKSNNIDLIIPRGGEGLINFVKTHSNIPVIVSGRGNNFLFVDATCDFDMALDIIQDGKRRISVCNALDKVLIHKDLPQLKVRMDQLVNLLKNAAIEITGDATVQDWSADIEIVKGQDIWYEEFLAPKIFIAMTNGVDEAIDAINQYSGKHSATIVTSNPNHANQFLQDIDSAAVYHNASTRFTDGGQFGFGAEMAISTQKLHFRGPIGIDQLVTNKWLVFGNGQIRS